MRIFIYEYACAVGDLGEAITLPESIRAEGRAMLSAVVDDFARVPDVEVQTLIDVRADREEEAFRTHVSSCEWSLIIAPEFDDLLLTRCRWVEEVGGKLLGPSSQAVQLAGDKWATYQLLREAGVPTPRTSIASGRGGVLEAPVGAELARASKTQPRPPQLVVKPRFGAGSQGVRLLAPGEAVPTGDSLLIQEYVEGIAASVAFLAGPKGLVPLLPGYQLLSDDGEFRYLGGRIPLPADLAGRAVRIARQALEPLPGLRGYLGVDVVLGDQGDFVIEINPRLTTSYVGLRALAETDLAEAMLAAAAGELPELRWREGAVVFKPNGRVSARSGTCQNPAAATSRPTA